MPIQQPNVTHPTILHAKTIQALCRPLNSLNIDYFCHAKLDHDGRFSAIGSNPQFAKQYLTNQYYNIDIHTATSIANDRYIVWDMFEPTGQSLAMAELAYELGIRHTFSIVKIGEHGKDFYHFASSNAGRSINQRYVNQIDLLEAFIASFKEKANQSRELSSAYGIKYCIDPETPGYTTNNEDEIIFSPESREAFLQELLGNQMSSSKSSIVQHKVTHTPIQLSPQRMRCLSLLSKGYSAKDIARVLMISTRTAEHHIEYLRKALGCRNSKEIIATYGQME